MKNCCSGVKPSITAGRGLAFERFLVGEVGDLGAAKVSDAFAKDEFAVVMDIFLDEVVIELVGHAGSAGLKGFQVGVGPPVSQATQIVKLRAFVVEAVGDFVADDHADGAVVDGIDGFHVEGWRLKNAGRKDDFVQQRVVVRVGGERSHAPAAAIDSFSFQEIFGR